MERFQEGLQGHGALGPQGTSYSFSSQKQRGLRRNRWSPSRKEMNRRLLLSPSSVTRFRCHQMKLAETWFKAGLKTHTSFCTTVNEAESCATLCHSMWWILKHLSPVRRALRASAAPSQRQPLRTLLYSVLLTGLYTRIFLGLQLRCCWPRLRMRYLPGRSFAAGSGDVPRGKKMVFKCETKLRNKTTVCKDIDKFI